VLLNEFGWTTKRMAEHFGTTVDLVSRVLFPELPHRDMTGAEEWAGHYVSEIEHMLLCWASTALRAAASMAKEAGFTMEAASLAARAHAKHNQWLATRGTWELLTGPQLAVAWTDARIAIGIDNEKDWPSSLVEIESRFEIETKKARACETPPTNNIAAKRIETGTDGPDPLQPR
jgi:hypothetical protein